MHAFIGNPIHFRAIQEETREYATAFAHCADRRHASRGSRRSTRFKGLSFSFYGPVCHHLYPTNFYTSSCSCIRFNIIFSARLPLLSRFANMVSLMLSMTNFADPDTTSPAMSATTVNAYDATNADQWEVYRSYRPQYPASLFQRIYTYHIINGGTFEGTAHDAGCGPGITAAILSLQFKHVLCSDFSQTAINSARANLLGSAQAPCKSSTNANFTFKVSSAEDMSWISPAPIDMVTMSEALHWTDPGRTIAAAAGVLKPGGTFAAWYYTQPRLPDNPAAEKIFRNMQSHWCKLRRDFSEQSERTLWIEQSGYDCINFPSNIWEDVRRVKRDVWIRDSDLAHMRFQSQVNVTDQVEFLEDVQDWQQDVNLDWFRGWFESLFPKIDAVRLTSMLEAMETALGPRGTTRAVWPVVILLASKRP